MERGGKAIGKGLRSKGDIEVEGVAEGEAMGGSGSELIGVRGDDVETTGGV